MIVLERRSVGWHFPQPDLGGHLKTGHWWPPKTGH